MRTKKEQRSKHELILEQLVKQLSELGLWDTIETHVDYNRNGYCGEVDVLGHNHILNVYGFYEVKCSNIKNRQNKAEEQYQRYRKAHPEQSVLGLMVTPKKNIRLY